MLSVECLIVVSLSMPWGLSCFSVSSSLLHFPCFCRSDFPLALVGEIVFAESLVDFGDGVPTSAVLLDATLLHEEVNQILLLSANMPEVVEESPAVYIESVLYVLQQRTFSSFSDVVISARVARLRVRDANGHLVGLLSVRKQCRGRFHQGELQQLGLDTAVAKSHRISATVAVDEPLAQVAWEFYVDVIVAHNCCWIVTSAKILLFSCTYICGRRGLRYFILYVCRFVGSTIQKYHQ